MVKGSLAWKEVTVFIITAIIIPILAWGSSAFIGLKEEVAVLKNDAQSKKETIMEIKEDVSEIKTDIKSLLRRK